MLVSTVNWLSNWLTDIRTQWVGDRDRLVTLTYLLTDKLVSSISRLTDWLTDKRKHTWQGVGVTHSFSGSEIGDYYQHLLTYRLVDSRKDTHWKGGRRRMAALIYQQRSLWALSVKLISGWLRKVHTLGRVMARQLVALTHLMTEK